MASRRDWISPSICARVICFCPADKAAAAKAAEPRTRRRLEAGEKLSDIRGTLDFIRSRGFAVDMP